MRQAGRETGRTGINDASLYPGYLLDFVKLVERFDRGQGVDVESLDLVADLHQYGVVELEHRQLHVLRRSVFGGFHDRRRRFLSAVLDAQTGHDFVVAVNKL